MTEIEVPLEKLQQDLEHAATHGDHGSQQNWVTWSALLSALLAVLAAVAALQAGHQINEAMLNQLKASDTWSFFQAKSIKSNITETRSQILQGLGKTADANLEKKLAQYADEQKELKHQAETLESTSKAHFHKHEVFATAVTFFQISIAVTAIAVLARRRNFLLVAGSFGAVGIYFLITAFLLGGGGH